MTPRSIRRAAERRAQKEARKALRQLDHEAESPLAEPAIPDTLDWEPAAPSAARQAANLRNSQLSTGPRTEAGKRISSLNALGDEAAVLSLPKTQAVPGLTGRTVLLPSDDAAAYRAHIAAYHSAYSPIGHRESELVQSLADTQWRLTRISSLEMALYAKGRLELADSVAPSPDPALTLALLDLEIHLKYEKQIRNLQLQESRLHRRYTLDAAELRRLQADRKAATETAAKTSPIRSAAISASAAATPTQFVFSTGPAQPETQPESNSQAAPELSKKAA